MLDAFQALGRVYQRAQRPEKALDVWNRLEKLFPDCSLDFRYRVIRVWELPVERLLEGNVGTLPLAPLAPTCARVPCPRWNGHPTSNGRPRISMSASSA